MGRNMNEGSLPFQIPNTDSIQMIEEKSNFNFLCKLNIVSNLGIWRKQQVSPAYRDRWIAPRLHGRSLMANKKNGKWNLGIELIFSFLLRSLSILTHAQVQRNPPVRPSCSFWRCVICTWHVYAHLIHHKYWTWLVGLLERERKRRKMFAIYHCGMAPFLQMAHGR